MEPAVAGGTLLVVGYGISERLLPGLLHFQHSISAQGRLEQPLTYWNAMGEVAAIGVVLCLRIAGDSTTSSGAATGRRGRRGPPGHGALPVLLPRRAVRLRGGHRHAGRRRAVARAAAQWCGVAFAAAVLGALAVTPSHSVSSLAGNLATRERQGAITLAVLALIMRAAALVQSAADPDRGPASRSGCHAARRHDRAGR